MVVSYKVSDNLKKEIIDFYSETKREKTPPYAVFQSEDAGTIVTLYESGKIVFQGVSADIDYAWWRDREKHINNRDIDYELAIKNKKEKNEKNKSHEQAMSFYGKNTIGSDEVGTGDYFGPIIVTASYVRSEDADFLNDLGVKDSKKITDDAILKIAPKIIEKIPFVTYELSPEDYNNKGVTNMNKVKSLLHNKALYSLINKDDYKYSYIVVDEFVYPKKYYEHLNNVQNKVTGITFMTKAEDKCLSVAVSSIISRYRFLMCIKDLEEKYNMTIPKGAGEAVDKAAKEFVKKYGSDELRKCVKWNFNNTKKIGLE